MKKPYILMTMRSIDDPKAETRRFMNLETYFQYIRAAGGIPFVMKADSREEAEEAAGFFDGLVITGGEDCDPALYHEENTASEVIDADLEKSDLDLYYAFRDAGKPVLGICRGMQVIAVAEGCSLIQDIPTEKPGSEHNQLKMDPAPGRHEYAHPCSFVKNTRMYEIFSDSHMINSFHHQAVRSVPEGFTLSGMSPDGFIEAMEKDHITAVQWHPERLLYDPKHLAVAQLFISDCLSKKAG